ncbi:cytidine deaminase [Pseudoalteromonas luteoviolacea]|uniref:cytidine deaminase n=1 Tax=Pseudoalteromonas luteoviolacea TaxID=43657 RepID=UPI001152B626|nr:cytidine deaminase [Pseudoalteromonas luteoviolacea]TQF67493.1 cytidine deaminase [Pseudoalteromonas luteoviolacea]
MALIDNKTELFIIESCKQSHGVINSELVNQLILQLECDIESLQQALLPIAATFAQAPISSFYVGAVIFDKQTGNMYLGANLEFKHQALSLVVHAEQAAIANAWINGAKEITSIAINAAPCGFCRQFMNELSTAGTLEILLPTGRYFLEELLPCDFGPQDLGNQESLMSHKKENIEIELPVSEELKEQVRLAYVPYSKNMSAAELVLTDGRVFYGRYAENAAYSPSLSPMSSVLSQLALAGEKLPEAEVERITLVETKGYENQKSVAQAVLTNLNGDSSLVHHVFEAK